MSSEASAHGQPEGSVHRGALERRRRRSTHWARDDFLGLCRPCAYYLWVLGVDQSGEPEGESEEGLY